jgi:hypothetical protein
MSRQSTAPVQFAQSTRKEDVVAMSSGRAGKVQPVCYFPLFMGDSCSGKVGVDINLAEMPRPLLNAVTANVQAWFVPKSAHPQYSGRDELIHAYAGTVIKAAGQADRTPPAFFTVLAGAAVTTAAASEFFQGLGIHIPTGASINSDLIDAFSVIYNFRLAAHSTKLSTDHRRKFAFEDIAAATALPRAFWPSSRFSGVVSSYERALIVGQLDLDIAAGSIPLSGLAPVTGFGTSGVIANAVGSFSTTATTATFTNVNGAFTMGPLAANLTAVTALMTGQTIGTSLADIDKARTTQAFAKLRASYASNGTGGFDNDDTLVAMLMQGFSVPSEHFRRPWLLDSKRVPVGFTERFASDGANLDDSVTLGRASVSLSLNVPQQDVGGIVIVTVEVLPERLDERMSDEWLLTTATSGLPNALRDVQRIEPVDIVTNRRVDAKHTTPNGAYGFEPMNDKWNRSFTRLGGKFFQATPGTAFSQQRAAIWQTGMVNPDFAASHFLAPAVFPHDVFSDTLAPAFETVCRHVVAIRGLTQIGDVLAENTTDYTVTLNAGV